MIVALFGGDEAAIAARLREIKDEADGGTGMLESNLTVLDGRDTKAQEIAAAAMAVPFLGPYRLVVVERLLERYQPHGFGERDRRSLAPVEPLLDLLQRGVPPTTILVFTGFPVRDDQDTYPVTPTNPLVKAISGLPGASLEHFPAPDAKSIPAYIERAASARGLRFVAGRHGFSRGEAVPSETSPVALLAALTHGDTLHIANELDKLQLYTGGGEVTLADVCHVCAGDRIAGGFEFSDAVLDGNLARALQLLARIREWGVDPGETLYDLSNTFRRIAPVVELVDEGAPPDVIGQAMGNAGRYPGLRDTAIRRARAIGISGLKRAFETLAAADRDGKTGLVDRELALELAVSELCAIAARR